MAVAHVTANSANAAASSTALPGFNITPSGSDRLMLIGVRYQQDVGATTITVGGNAATKIAHATNGSNICVELWYYLAPDASSLAIAGTLAVASSGRVLAAACFSGVDQTTPLGSSVTGTGSSTTPSVVVAGGSADGLCFAVVGPRFPAASITAGDTVSWEVEDAGNDNYCGGSYLAGASGTLDWTLGGSASWGMVGVPILPVAGARRFILVRP
jgi:hypothetical protein